MSKLVLIDSQILIWGVKGFASPGQEDNIATAKLFMQWISDNDYKILMPLPQLVELASYAPPEHQHVIYSMFTTKGFQVVPFDELTTQKCSELLHKSLNEQELVVYRADNKVPKAKIKFDCMLAASAIVRGAVKIFSNDNDLKKFSCGQIDVSEMPKIVHDLNLFGDVISTKIIH